MAIYEWDHFHVNRCWIWTAVTRARNLDNVRLFLNAENNTNLEYQYIDCYLQQKITAYKQQDKKARRFIFLKQQYVSVEWLSSCFGRCCTKCGDTFSCEVKGSKVSSNLTANRVDNRKPHYIDNIIPLCVNCNCKFIKQIIIFRFIKYE